jgi:Xaa-Pro aminopeptidase
VEPGIYIAADNESVDERWRGIGIRIEDDVLVTEDGHAVLSEGIPKDIDDVESACA